MANTTDRQVVNGVTYMIKDTEARSHIDDIKSSGQVLSELNLSQHLVSGKFIRSDGTIASSSDFYYNVMIPLMKNESIVLVAKGYQTAVAMISIFSDDGEISPQVVSEDSNVKKYTYTATNDCMVALSYMHTGDEAAYIVTGATRERDEMFVHDDVAFTHEVTGYFIRGYDGSVAENESFNYTRGISLGKGSTIELFGQGYSTAVAMISEEKNGAFFPLAISVNSTQMCYRYTADHDMMVALSYQNIEHIAVISTNRMEILWGSAGDAQQLNCWNLFPRLAVIGDSLASGALFNGTRAEDTFGDSWLSYVARRTNAAARTHYSNGGQTAKGWLETYLTKLQEDNAFSAYFIALGTNDRYSHPYDLGNITDAAGTDSFVGYYKQIIEAIRTKAPNSVIFCVSLYNNITQDHTWSEMISDISDLYDNCFYVDFINRTKIWINSGEPYVDEPGSHFTSIGYNYVANVIIECVNDIVDRNKDWFEFFGLNNSVGEKYEN